MHFYKMHFVYYESNTHLIQNFKKQKYRKKSNLTPGSKVKLKIFPTHSKHK